MKMNFLVLGVLLFFIGSCTKATGKKGTASVYYPVKKGPMEGKVGWRGVVRSANRIEIRSDRKVKISKVLVSNNQAVKKGDLLIEVDRTEIEAKKRELVDKTKAMDLERNSSRFRLEHAQKVLNRKTILSQKGIIARKEFEEAQREFRVAEMEIKSKELDAEKNKREVDELEDQLKSSNFFAPMDGIISGIANLQDSNQGEVSPGQVMAVVFDPKVLALWVQVEESNLHRVAVGTKVELELDSFVGDKFQGTVTEVSVSASDPQQRSFMKSYGVSIVFDPKGKTVKEGFSGNATLVYAKKDGALTIPISGLRYMDGKEFVQVASSDQGSVQNREVKTGIQTDDEVEIVTGVSEKDFVVAEVESN